MLIDEIKDCSKCGICRAVCPVFFIVNDEVMSPRGRISLVEALIEGNLSVSDRYTDIIRSCIKCTRCADVCPSGVRPEKIVQSAREMLYNTTYTSKTIKEILRSTLDRGRFRNYIVKKFREDKPDNTVPLWFLPLIFHGNAYLPNLAEKTVLEKYPEDVNNGRKQKVGLFIGCSINYSNTDIADSAIDVLEKLEISIFIPKDQTCCGVPLLFYGDVEGAKELAKVNIKAFKYDDLDAILTICPACGITLKQEYNRLVNDSDLKTKVYDISEYIAKFTSYNTRKLDISVTYHDPCYLRLGQEVLAEPRKILKGITDYIEMKDANKCCGLGGTLGLLHPEISQKIGEDKLKNIANSNADIVATGCPGCILFIRDMLKKAEINKKVLHTVQILQKSLLD